MTYKPAFGLPCLHITPEMIERTYELLRVTPPYNRWKLPPGEEVEFGVMNCAFPGGDCLTENGKTRIRISTRRIGRLHNLVEYVAHEMVHMHIQRKGIRTEHGREFKAAAKVVCRHHGFDPKLF